MSQKPDLKLKPFVLFPALSQETVSAVVTATKGKTATVSVSYMGIRLGNRKYTVGGKNGV